MLIGSGKTLAVRGDISVGADLIIEDGGTLIPLSSRYEINTEAEGTRHVPYGTGFTIMAASKTVSEA